MNIYLLVDNKTDDVVGVYKYEEVALIAAERKGFREAILKTFQGVAKSQYRVEVHKVVE